MDISIKQEEKRVISRTSYQTRRRLTWVIFMLPAIAVYVAFMAFPLFNSMRLSLYTGQCLTPERFVGFDNYVRLFTNPLWRDAWLNAFGNTWVCFAVHLPVPITLGLLSAVQLIHHIRGRSTYQVIIYAPVTPSPLVIGFL